MLLGDPTLPGRATKAPGEIRRPQQLPICPSTYLFAYLPIYIYLSFHRRIYPLIYLSLCLSTYPFIYLPASPPTHSPIHPSIHLSIHLFVYLLIYL